MRIEVTKDPVNSTCCIRLLLDQTLAERSAMGTLWYVVGQACDIILPVIRKHISIMNLFGSITLVLFFSSTCSSQSLDWSSNRKLIWEDFKGPTKDWNVAAVTYCGISMDAEKLNIWNGRSTYRAKAEFDPDSSFYFPEKVDEYILAHEQLHFDIAELFARKMNAIFTEEGFISAERATEIYDTLYKAYFEFQSLFEEETELGSDRTQQDLWTLNVRSQMRTLENK